VGEHNVRVIEVFISSFWEILSSCLGYIFSLQADGGAPGEHIAEAAFASTPRRYKYNTSRFDAQHARTAGATRGDAHI
jgi:hypothetical protein